MHLQESERYQHDLNVVIDMMLDDDYNREKITDLRGGRNYQVISRKKDQEFFHIKVKYDECLPFPANFPPSYKKYIKASNTYISTVEWELQDSEIKIGHVTIEIPGLPLTIYGHLELRNCQGGCERSVELKIEYSMPFIGKYISRWFTDIIQQSLLEEYEFNRLFLERLHH